MSEEPEAMEPETVEEEFVDLVSGLPTISEAPDGAARAKAVLWAVECLVAEVTKFVDTCLQPKTKVETAEGAAGQEEEGAEDPYEVVISEFLSNLIGRNQGHYTMCDVAEIPDRFKSFVSGPKIISIKKERQTRSPKAPRQQRRASTRKKTASKRYNYNDDYVDSDEDYIAPQARSRAGVAVIKSEAVDYDELDNLMFPEPEIAWDDVADVAFPLSGAAASAKADKSQSSRPKVRFENGLFFCNVPGCPQQHEGFATVTEFQEHADNCQASSSAHSYNYCCKSCDAVFRTQEELSKHAMKHMAELNAITMKRASIGLAKNKRLIAAKARSSDGTNPNEGVSLLLKKKNEFKCDACDFKGESREQLKEHSHQAHLGSKAFKCTMCEEAFYSKKTLQTHKRNVHEGRKENPYCCEICGKSFAFKSYLRSHVMSHSQDMNSICDLCGKRFRSIYHLKGHIHNAHKSKSVTCPHCGVSVKNPTVLRKHFQYRHSGEKVDETRKCDKCDVVSKNYIAHRKHQAIDHGVGKLYTCEQCGQQNVQRLKHLRHIREVHERKRIQCPHCESAFRRENILKKHIQDVHQNVAIGVAVAVDGTIHAQQVHQVQVPQATHYIIASSAQI